MVRVPTVDVPFTMKSLVKTAVVVAVDVATGSVDQIHWLEVPTFAVQPAWIKVSRLALPPSTCVLVSLTIEPLLVTSSPGAGQKSDPSTGMLKNVTTAPTAGVVVL
jgi:hypothetical protein